MGTGSEGPVSSRLSRREDLGRAVDSNTHAFQVMIESLAGSGKSTDEGLPALRCRQSAGGPHLISWLDLGIRFKNHLRTQLEIVERIQS